jgi:GT2 family glycosyltransferase
MKLSILVVSKTPNLLNALLKSLSTSTTIEKHSIEILVSWNGCHEDIYLINQDIYQNFFITTIIPYHFASNMNKLLDKARGEYLILVNDDVVFDIETIDKGIEFFESNSNIVLIGSRLRDNNDNLSHAGILFNLFLRPYHFLQGSVRYDHQVVTQSSYPVTAVTGALMLTKIEFLRQHRFNPNYSICGEDVELCLDLREKFNKDIFYCHEFSAIHQAETTRSSDPLQYKTFHDNLLISKRYFRFIFKSNISHLRNELKYVQAKLSSYKTFKIYNFFELKNSKWDLTLSLFYLYLKFLKLIRKIFSI